MRLYVHWPFCASRCSYCDFNSRVAERVVMYAYREALLSEAATWVRRLTREQRSLLSLYVGGGTPSTLSGEELAALIGDLLREGFTLIPGAEITVEVNPATWSRGDFEAARAGGVNRFSVGVQSLDDGILRKLGRAHNAAQALEAVRDAQDTGARVSVDLLYGLPGGGQDGMERTLRAVLDMRPHHLSLYALTLEEGVPLAERVRCGEVALPDEDACAYQYLAALGLLEKYGYRQYEISNYCLPGFHSRHNLAYWKREEYLGLGAGAHSFIRGRRFHNHRSLLRYIRCGGSGSEEAEGREPLPAGEEREEEIMLGLRTTEGIQAGLLEGKGALLLEMERWGLLGRRGNRVALTPRGMLVSNAVIAELLA